MCKLAGGILFVVDWWLCKNIGEADMEMLQ
jgi:hypothetical protein